MARKYDSSRRAEAAQKTKEAILDAAFKLHGRGILDLDSLAVEANVSLATIRKYYPTREELYAGCTNWGMRYAAFPDLEQIALISEPEERLRAAVAGLHDLYDSLFGHLWMSYLYMSESAVLGALVAELEGLQTAATNLGLGAWPAEISDDPEARGVVRGLASYLTYHAFIAEGGLSAEQARPRIAEALLNSLRAIVRRKEGANA